MANVTIRLATIADAEEIRAIYNHEVEATPGVEGARPAASSTSGSTSP